MKIMKFTKLLSSPLLSYNFLEHEQSHKREFNDYPCSYVQLDKSIITSLQISNISSIPLYKKWHS